MGSIWKKIQQVTEEKMVWLSRTRTKGLTPGRVVNISEVRYVFLVLSVRPEIC